MYITRYVYIYIYIHVHRERERHLILHYVIECNKHSNHMIYYDIIIVMPYHIMYTRNND